MNIETETKKSLFCCITDESDLSLSKNSSKIAWQPSPEVLQKLQTLFREATTSDLLITTLLIYLYRLGNRENLGILLVPALKKKSCLLKR